MAAIHAGPAKLALRAAMETGDLPAVVASFAPGAVFRSPFTANLTFQGRDQVAVISAVVLDVFEGFHYTEEVRVGDVAFLVWEAEVGGQKLTGVDHVKLDNEGLVEEFTVFFRPLPSTAAALRVVGAHLGVRRSRLLGALMSALAAPLVVMTRAGDAVGVRLIKSTL